MFDWSVLTAAVTVFAFRPLPRDPGSRDVVPAQQSPMPRPRRDDDFDWPDVEITDAYAEPDDVAIWLGEQGVTQVDSIADLHEHWTAYSMLYGFKYASQAKVGHLVGMSDMISKWRDRRAKNATRYSITSAFEAAERAA